MLTRPHGFRSPDRGNRARCARNGTRRADTQLSRSYASRGVEARGEGREGGERRESRLLLI